MVNLKISYLVLFGIALGNTTFEVDSSVVLPEWVDDINANATWTASMDFVTGMTMADAKLLTGALPVENPFPRASFGGGADLYVRSPDNRPEDMPDNHGTGVGKGGVVTIRSFVALEAKLRQRMLSGESSGLSESRMLRCYMYCAPTSRPQWPHVRVDLQVVQQRAAPPPPVPQEPMQPMEE